MPTGGNEAEWLTPKKRIDMELRSLNPAWQIIPWSDGFYPSNLICHPVPEHQEIVRRVDGLFALADQLEGCLPRCDCKWTSSRPRSSPAA